MPEYVILLALFAVLFACNLAVAWAACRGAAPDSPGSRPERLDDGRLRCPDCETVNEPDYRFCRQCVAALRESTPVTPTRPAGERSPFR